MRETEWYPETEEVIVELAERLLPADAERLRVNLGGPRRIALEVALPPSLVDAAGRWLASAADRETNATLYHVGDGALGWLQGRYAEGRATSPFLGLYDAERRVALFAGSSSFGLLRSVLFGLASRVHLSAGHYPAHGCLADLGNGATLLAGGHGAGKTTALLELMARVRRRRDATVWSDDWAVYRHGPNGLVGVPLERTIALDAKSCETVGSARLRRLYLCHRSVATRVVILPPEEVFPGLRPAAPARLSRVVILASPSEAGWRRDLSVEECASLLVEQVYHMPDTGGLASVLEAFWRHSLGAVERYAVDLRSPGLAPEQRYRALARSLVGDVCPARSVGGGIGVA